MSIELKARLEQLKIDYIEIMDDLNIQKADGSLSKLCNLRDQFDETFDSFYTDDIKKKYKFWNYEEDCDADYISNSAMEEKLDDEDLQKLIVFYENYIERLEDELNEYISEETSLADVLSLQEAAEQWGLSDGYLRNVIAGKYKEKQFTYDEYRKTGRNYIIKKSAMERLYGERKNNV